MTPLPLNKPRPLSPHLQIYKPQLTSGLSILHRITGVSLAIGLPIFVLWLVTIAEGPVAYEHFLTYAHSLIGQLVLFGFTFAFFFHFSMGIRHLFWDMGLFLDIKEAYRTGYLAVAFAVLLTAGIWLKYIWCQP